jgi:UDP-N-acetylmuramoylalanine--D-glutamate ligase
MSEKFNLKKNSFLIYGLGSTGHSVVKYFKKKKVHNFFVWDDNKKLSKKFGSNKIKDLRKVLKKVDYIVLSPGISLKKTIHKKDLIKFKNKIITDIDLLYLSNSKFKSIVITGSNGKSTTCKIITHLLKKNKFDVEVGGNIGTPVLNLKIKKNIFFVIEASSFQLSHSRFIHPNYAILLNITNDHVDWHGSVQAYINSKLKIFNLKKKNDFALVNSKIQEIFKKKKYLSKLVPIKFKEYKKIKFKIKNDYLKSNTNDENMNFVYTMAKLLKININSFVKSMNSFLGLPHRYEIFLKKKSITFINDSKATSFQATKFALKNNKNIYWILGGLPKKNDKIVLKNIKNNIIKSYIIGKNINFFIKQLKNKVKFSVTNNLKNSILSALKDIRQLGKKNNIILLSPSAASFDQFKNFENRGNEFKKLSRLYAKKII